MDALAQAEKDFEASMRRSQELSKNIEGRMKQSRELNDELEQLANKLAEMCER